MNRVFVEKQSEFNAQARELLHDLRDNLNIHHIEDVRVLQRYDVDGLTEAQFEAPKQEPTKILPWSTGFQMARERTHTSQLRQARHQDWQVPAQPGVPEAL